MTKAVLDGRAILRAVTRVKPEQASKSELWTPTRQVHGEGRAGRGRKPMEAPVPVHRGSGHGTQEEGYGQRGRSVSVGGRTSKVAIWRLAGRKSEGGTVLLKPGNAGGGKAP